MFRHPFFYFLFCLLIVITAMHVFGIMYFWYATYPLLDLVLHFVGGFWIAGISLWIFFLSGASRASYKQKIPKVHVVLGVLFFTVMIGALWEIFEVINDITLRGYPKYEFDTITDLIADSMGALLAGWYFVRRYL